MLLYSSRRHRCLFRTAAILFLLLLINAIPFKCQLCRLQDYCGRDILYEKRRLLSIVTYLPYSYRCPICWLLCETARPARFCWRSTHRWKRRVQSAGTRRWSFTPCNCDPPTRGRLCFTSVCRRAVNINMRLIIRTRSFFGFVGGHGQRRSPMPVGIVL